MNQEAFNLGYDDLMAGKPCQVKQSPSGRFRLLTKDVSDLDADEWEEFISSYLAGYHGDDQ